MLQLAQLSREKEHQSVVDAGASQEAQTSSVELQKQHPSKGVTVGFCEGRGDGDGVGRGVGLGVGAKTGAAVGFPGVTVGEGDGLGVGAGDGE